MRFQRVFEQVFFRPWFITAEGHAAVARVVKNAMVRADGMPGAEMFANPREEMEILPSGIAKIHVCGVEEGARGIFLEISSPGGTVVGNAEIAEAVQACPIPVLAFSDDLACSAAYNIAVSADWAFGTPSSTWGSIGTIIPWIDQSAMWAAEGMDWQPITNAEGDLKAAMHGPSLTPDQRASLEQYVQDAFEQFRGNVLRRRLVSADAMRGQAFLAPRALANNLIDKIALEDEAMAFLETQLS